MEYIFICPQCGASFGCENTEGRKCPDCHVETQYSGYNSEDWYALKGLERVKIKNQLRGVAPKKTPFDEGAVYCLDGSRGRHLDVYEDKCVFSVSAGIGSFLTGNGSDGEKTVYYVDCIGVQFKRAGLQLGYLQLETASGLMNNKQSNFFNENSFTFEPSKVSNEKMEEVAAYVKSRIDVCKRTKNVGAPAISPAEEIKKFKELLDMEVITQEEFDAKKKQLLGL